MVKKTKNNPIVIEAMAFVCMGLFTTSLAFFSLLLAWVIVDGTITPTWLVYIWVINMIGFIGSHHIYYMEVTK